MNKGLNRKLQRPHPLRQYIAAFFNRVPVLAIGEA
jgi:hypothetical protein